MLKILIADDDKIIRRGLRAIIEENTPENQILDEVMNGVQALESILRVTPDLVVTDIKMPVMDGIELIENICKLDLNIKFIVLSGFDEYKYIRETMKHGAVDYLLKPVDDEQFIDLLRKIDESIAKDSKKLQHDRLQQERIAESDHVLRGKLLKELIKGSSGDWESYRLKMEELDIFNAEKYLLVKAAVDNSNTQGISWFEDRRPHLLKILRDKIEELGDLYEKHYQVLIAENDMDLNILFIAGANNTEEFEKDIFLFFNNLNEITGKQENAFTFTVGASKIFERIEMVYSAMHQSELAYESRYYAGKGRIITYQQEECVYNVFDQNKIENEFNSLLNYIELCEAFKARKSIGNIIKRLAGNKTEPDELRKILSDIVRKISAVLQEFKDITEKNADEFHIFNHIENTDTLSELEHSIPELFYSIVEKMSRVRMERSKKTIEIAKDYIQKHYNENLNLKTVAEYVHLNITYFSEIFKSETGKNFVDYVMEKRISHAKKLLADPEIKIYEAGIKVGYAEPVSFNRAFKNVVGISPAQYRKVIK